MNEYGRYTETLRTIARIHDVSRPLLWYARHRWLARVVPPRIVRWWVFR